jgi:hypothetical protein
MICTAIILLLLTAEVAFAQDSDNSANLACIGRLEIPKYPALADSARVTATVTTSLRLESNGSVGTITSDVSNKISKAVESAFVKTVDESLHSSKFLAACGGRMMTFIFQFSLGDQIGTQRFSFSYPNRFTVLAPTTVMNP